MSSQERDERMQELCKLAIAEFDGERLLALVTELNRLLSENEAAMHPPRMEAKVL